MSTYEIIADEQNHLYLKCHTKLAKRAHFHRSVELVIVLEGAADAYINGVHYELKTGDAAFSGAFDVHYYKEKEDSRFAIFVIGQEYLRAFYEHADKQSVPAHFSLPTEALTHARRWLESPEESNQLRLISNIYYLLSFLPLLPAENASPKPKTLITEIFAHLHESFREHLTIESTAKKFGYSRGYLSTLFSAYTGESFNSYLNRLRVVEVKRLQAEAPDTSVLQLAFDVGFESASTFYRAYKKQFGETPRQKI